MARDTSASTPTDAGATPSRRQVPTSSCSTTMPQRGGWRRGSPSPACRPGSPAATSARRSWFRPMAGSSIPASGCMTALGYFRSVNPGNSLSSGRNGRVEAIHAASISTPPASSFIPATSGATTLRCSAWIAAQAGSVSPTITPRSGIHPSSCSSTLQRRDDSTWRMTLLRRCGLRVLVRQHVGRYAHFGGELERCRRSVRVSQFDKKCSPAFRRLLQLREINAVTLVRERAALPGVFDCHQAEIARVGIGRLPEFHLARLIGILHADDAILLDLPRELRELRALHDGRVAGEQRRPGVAAAQRVVAVRHITEVFHAGQLVEIE